MTDIISLSIADWGASGSPEQQDAALRALEDGNVVLLPQLAFSIREAEQPLLAAAVAGSGKNISLHPATGEVRGSNTDAAQLELLRAMMTRFAGSSAALIQGLLPSYAASIQPGRTSFRPIEIAGRATSWRKDDTRLHIDSFPSSPTRGKRILRLFTNVNPHGQRRIWRFGESFEAVARRFGPSLRSPAPGTAALLDLLGITKGRRSAYDHVMLQLHDRMKAEAAYQAQARQHTQAFASGSTWLVYTDQVSHAALAGQHALEQTFYLPVDGMAAPSKSPLRVLEGLMQRTLV